MFFLEKPEGFHSQMDVVGCYVEHKGKFLFLLRHSKKSQGNTWCVPGGKVEVGEKIQSAAVRELQEESGICVQEKDLVFFRKIYKTIETKSFCFHMFYIKLDTVPEVKLSPTEHTDFVWAPLDQLPFPIMIDEDHYTQMLKEIL